MKRRKKVIVTSFMGTDKPDNDIEDEFNYWKLIGMKGIVIEQRDEHPFYKDKGEQILIQFDKNIKKWDSILITMHRILYGFSRTIQKNYYE